ncbi:hypothetical protein HDG38_001875 [Paraburkholderia sp. WSM4177]|nr:hypothetical protein [Paraburkholderia sp. WSM4177]MBB5483129.1 hypothetical protein [Paraburkholderia sp. WSM4180]
MRTVLALYHRHPVITTLLEWLVVFLFWLLVVPEDPPTLGEQVGLRGAK